METEPEYLTPLQRQYLEQNPEASIVSQKIDDVKKYGVAGGLGFLAFYLTALSPLLMGSRNVYQYFWILDSVYPLDMKT